MRQRQPRIQRENYVIYCATNKVNDKSYIGQTFQFEKRRHDHFKKSEDKGHKRPFHAALQNHGRENFEWRILEEVDSLEAANEAEEFYIGYLNTLYPNGYNLVPGGNNKRLLPITKERIRDKLKVVGSFVGKRGKDHPNFGRKQTEEWKLAQSESKAGSKGPNTKLTEKQVVEIYKMGLDGYYATEVKEIFNCGRSTVLNIYKRKSWKELLAPLSPIDMNLLKRGGKLKQAKLTESLVIQILNEASKLPGSLYKRSVVLAKQQDMSTTQIYNILRGKEWKHIDRTNFYLSMSLQPH